jgi:hypothetical protein
MPATKKVKKSKAKSEAEPVVDAASEKSKTFTCFPKVPVELRLKIWGYASSVNRNVDIWVRSLDTKLIKPYERPLYFYTSLPPPAVLHVNSESRSESLKYYDLDFGTNITIKHTHSVPFTISIPSRIYFNWNTDRLCLVNPSELENKSIARVVSSQLANYHTVCQKKGLRYFAINIAHSTLPLFMPQRAIKNSAFLKLIPLESNLVEVVLFESSELADSKSLKINRLELEELDSKEQGRRMNNTKRAVEKVIKKYLEETGEISGRGTPFIRICKVNVQT